MENLTVSVITNIGASIHIAVPTMPILFHGIGYSEKRGLGSNAKVSRKSLFDLKLG